MAQTPSDFEREERAAIMEYDGGLSREEAELAAGITNEVESETAE